VDDLHLEVELLLEADERDHDLRLHLDLLLRHVSGGFEDGAGLHGGDFRIGDAETAATVAEHGVELMQSGDAGLHFFNGDAHFLRKVGLSGVFMRNEFVKGRVEKADGRRQAFEGFKDAGEVLTLIRKQLREGFFAVGDVVSEDHLTDGVDAVTFKEHVLCAREADALGTERDGVFGLLWIVGVRANLKAGSFAAPVHELLEALVNFSVACAALSP
jgi:hypothetical protein